MPVFLPRHHVVKLLLRYLTVLVEICPLDHFLELRLVDVLPHVPHHLLQPLQSDKSSALFVEQVKHLAHVALRVFHRHTTSHHFQELLELH